jgi:hypothetical protein
MKRIIHWLCALVCVSAASLGSVTAIHAQQAPQYQQAISVNPFGILLELFNGEYERVLTESSTAGVGGSYFSSDGDDYLNADAFYRFYPQGDALDGWAFGAKAGITSVESNTYFGAGFDVNRSWLLGKNSNFYVGLGFGLKRLFGTDDEEDFLEYIPTFRIVNIGFAF